MILNPDLHSQIKEALIQAIINLSLEEIGNNVIDEVVHDTTNIDYPCVLVRIEDDVEEPLSGDTTKTDWWYPVSIYLAMRESVHDLSFEKRMLRNRYLIMKLLDQRTLANLPVSVMYVTPRPIVNPEYNQFLEIISGLTVRVWATEYRF